jgi:hypothetical protein
MTRNFLYTTWRYTRSLILLTITALLVVLAPPMLTFGQTSAAINDVDWNADGTLLAIASSDGYVYVLNRSGQSVVSFAPVLDGSPVLSVAWNPVYQSILAISVSNSPVTVFNILGTQVSPVASVRTGLLVNVLDWNLNGTLLAASGETGGGASSESWVSIWNLLTSSLFSRIDSDYQITDLRWSPVTSSILAIAGVSNNFGTLVSVYDVNTNSLLWSQEDREAGVTYLDWSTTGDRLALAINRFGLVGADFQIRNATNGTVIATYPNDSERVADIDWSNTSNIAILGGRKVQIRDGVSYKSVSTMDNRQGAIDWNIYGDLASVNENESLLISLNQGNVQAVKPLLTPICSIDAVSTRNWRITNPNAAELAVTWHLSNSPTQMATVTLPANGTYDFSTMVEAGNETMRLLVNGQVVAEATGSAEPCGTVGL